MPRPGVPFDPADPDGKRSFIARIDPRDVEIDLSGGVPLSEREGVFAQSFRCMACTLHFVLFSWSATRHSPNTIECPECGNRGSFMHRTTQLSGSTRFRVDRDREPEIYDVWPFSLAST